MFGENQTTRCEYNLQGSNRFDCYVLFMMTAKYKGFKDLFTQRAFKFKKMRLPTIRAENFLF